MRCFTIGFLALVSTLFSFGQNQNAGPGFQQGQGARYVIGQPRFDAQDVVPIDEDNNVWKASQTLLGAAGGVAYADGRLFVAEANRVGAIPANHRVGIYRVNSFLPAPDAHFTQDDSRRCRVCGGVPDNVLGQPDFETRDYNITATGLRQPNYVHSDGRRIVVGDTDNNRVLIWNSIPTSNGAPADIVLGQENFTTGTTSLSASAKKFRAPQGVWIQGERLFVADTLYHRVLIWNTFPTSNAQAPDVVLGQPDLTTTRPPNLLDDAIPVSASNMLNPVSVTSDGTRLYVADLGHNRIMIWNAIPTSNNQPADIVIGQPDLASAESRLSNNSTRLCASNGVDDDDEPTYPTRCAATISSPRFALSDGRRLFVADGGNDRVLVFNNIPVANGASADVALGQPDEFRNIVSDSVPIFGEDVNSQLRSAVDIIRTPLSLATDGLNLFVPDAFNRRVLVYTPGELKVPRTAVRNAASLTVSAIGTIAFSGTLKKDEEITITIGTQTVLPTGYTEVVDEVEYKFKVPADDDVNGLVNGLVEEINKDGGDDRVLAIANLSAASVVLTAREGGPDGDNITMEVTGPTSTAITVATSGATLAGGRDAAKIGIGSLISIFGQRLAENEMAADMSGEFLPRTLGGVEVICDGHSIPLLYISPTQINAQMPFEFADSFSTSCYVRTEFSDQRVERSAAIAVPLIAQNPGIFADFSAEPRKAIAFHASSRASAVIFIDGAAKAGDDITIKIQDRTYEYEVLEEDIVQINDTENNSNDTEEVRTIDEMNQTNLKIRAKLIALINTDAEVEAYPTAFFTRILLMARQAGTEINGTIKIEASATEGANLSVQATRDTLGGANVAGAPVTPENPLEAGAPVVVYATGLGTLKNDGDNQLLKTGQRYTGSNFHELSEQLDSSITGLTNTVISAIAKPDTFGLYEITLIPPTSAPTNNLSQLTVYQSWYVSNIVAVPTKALPEEEEEEED